MPTYTAVVRLTGLYIAMRNPNPNLMQIGTPVAPAAPYDAPPHTLDGTRHQ